jgi:AcrR family transcriptional regulator
MRRTQEARSSATRTALVAVARELFGNRGFHAVPADEIVRAAGVTRGALYHHYADKQGLFRAVFEQVEREVSAGVEVALATAPDIGRGMPAVLGAFLDACDRPEVRQICLVDAPSVLGWSTWREIEAGHGLGLLAGALERALAGGLLRPHDPAILAQLLLSAMIEAALLIAHAEDPVAARVGAEQALGAWWGGLAATSGHIVPAPTTS